MAIVKPFPGYRPQAKYAFQIASRPYDVLNTEEARSEANGNPMSFLHVVKPEIDLPQDIDHYSSEVYEKGKENLHKLIADGIIFKDNGPCYYIYAQTMWSKTQYGLVGCAAVSDYMDNVVKKHELTRPDKEEDRKNHIRVTNFNAEPVFFAYPDNQTIDRIVGRYVMQVPEYDFESGDGVRHQVWIIRDNRDIREIEATFKNEIKYTYVADGHHRTAAAAHVGKERAENNPGHTGDEEYNFFMAVHFPASQLRIIDYNRVIKDLNGYSKEEFIEMLKLDFVLENKGANEYRPDNLHVFSMYLDGEWYKLQANPGIYDDSDPIGVLDVTVLSKVVLEPLLDIKDLRNSKRIDFVGGIRGLSELKRRVDSGEMAVAFALFPVSMKQLIDIADTNNIMPPKTTWFEPKLRSGLVIHELQ
jgi:uncharacterized protein (DUF1015 family)